MADGLSEPSIGKRIAAWRRRRGYRTARDLADAIPVDSITEAVIQNIEAGRKADLSISQLLNIAHGLRVAPAFLLAPVARPFDPVDLPNLGPKVAAMNVAEFTAWLAADGNAFPLTFPELADWRMLRAQRELYGAVLELSRLEASKQLEATQPAPPHLTREQWAEIQGLDTTDLRIRQHRERIDVLRKLLQEGGWFDVELPDEDADGVD